MTDKTLVTGGCSFSVYRGGGGEDTLTTPGSKTWARCLAAYLSGYNHIGTALPGQGNGIISRKIIAVVSKLLETTSPDKILVGIMWSGPNRHDFYHSLQEDFSGTLIENPTSITKDHSRQWVILNWDSNNVYSNNYYKFFHDEVGSLIYTYEHILRTQWFLKLHNIKYFMSTYTSEVFSEIGKTHNETKFLYDQIDFTKFLPVTGEYEWCRDQTNLPFRAVNDNHPSGAQHLEFTKQVVIPFLQTNNYL
jgi:hypothetical protein